MSSDIQSDLANPPAKANGKAFALICSYLVLTVAAGATRGLLHDGNLKHTQAMSQGSPSAGPRGS
jgi:hypothetical protein